MRIEQNSVFMFTFETTGGNLAIPVAGQTREEAAEKLKGMLSKIMQELAMEFPKIAPVPTTISNSEIGISGLTEIAKDRIEGLLAQLGGNNLNESAKSETLKNWTGLDFIPTNYAKIVNELELIASGQKKVEPPKKKGKQ